MKDIYRETWLIAWEALRALSHHYSPEMERVALADGIDSDHWNILITALCFHPDPISEELLQQRFPYQRYEHRLESMNRQGLLTKTGPTYQLSAEGERSAQKIIQVAYQVMDRLNPLKPPEMHCINQMLRKVVLACLDAPEPPGKWSIKLARRLDPGESAGIVVKLDQYLSDLAAYRDDAHLAAWQPYGVDGPTRETFTLIYQKDAASLEEVEDKLRQRGFSSQVYQDALDLLREKKWIRGANDDIQITEQGENLRQKTEDITDQYFFAPWSIVSDSEVEMMNNLLQMVTVGLD